MKRQSKNKSVKSSIKSKLTPEDTENIDLLKAFAKKLAKEEDVQELLAWYSCLPISFIREYVNA